MDQRKIVKVQTAAGRMPEMVGLWERVKDIGSGGFGMVVLWRNVTTDQKIAIKQCRWGEPGSGTEALIQPKVRDRWKKEVEIMLKLNHRGIVSCMPLPGDFQLDPAALPRLCMEYCEGGDLRRVLLRPENCCGLPELEVRQFLSDITDALCYLHGLRIIHRDLKPENVVLQTVHGKPLYKLIDLGYAKELDQSSVCTSFVGTLQYLAPELFLTNKYTCTADYWSLGLVAYEVVTGVRPFLPNMPPAMWMQHVSRKDPSHIAAERMEDGFIQFRSEISVCNHISPPLRHHLEGWLRRLLDWEPRRRGRPLPPAAAGSPQSAHGAGGQRGLEEGLAGMAMSTPAQGAAQAGPEAAPGPVIVFRQLQELLQRRVVAVFVNTPVSCYTPRYRRVPPWDNCRTISLERRAWSPPRSSCACRARPTCL
ncbi:inhibitor of nuclear factor kappa-B kinase subunit beta-like [Amphibalanus amphitrite]|uniref:inhibitor of nuclear factor kappa-B kinase subunit beta-like n=1 Tax=Amphibalanus amphitrite TaxID=1232801 RepID=UPI001C919524|nr:inhibitor of nuclear factor kappa-B kinase subunit beta-like [Amphibalanus amphitrite]